MAVQIPQSAADHYRAQQRLAVATMALVRREWAQMGNEFDRSWVAVAPRVLLLVASGQLGAARDALVYVTAVLAEQRIRVEPDAEPVPTALRGIASDGRPLDTLLDGAVIAAKVAVKSGLSPREALAVGGRWLEMVTQTQVADAARDATHLSIVTRETVGWVRLVNPPCCQRCAVLAGRFFRHNQGFARHPRCDCRHIPTTQSQSRTVGTVISPDDVKDLTARQRQRIAGGADFNKTINDYQRRRGDFLPPTRVDLITSRARTRSSAVEALTRAGYLAA